MPQIENVLVQRHFKLECELDTLWEPHKLKLTDTNTHTHTHTYTHTHTHTHTHNYTLAPLQGLNV